MGEVGKALAFMKSQGVQDLVFCGRVQRPNFSDMRVDWTGVKILPRLALAGAKGDDALLAFIVKEMEGYGYRVLGADQVLADLLATAGLWTKTSPTPEQQADIDRGREVVRAMGLLDIGQCAVISGGLVLAVEAAEGTDRMLARVAELPAELKGDPENRRGVLVKMPKPGQERRIDLPAIGLETLKRVASAGMAGIAVEAGGALVMDRQALIDFADSHGIFVLGFEKAGT
jgi:DUF1009 family protein